jgi:hypothetical protein
MSTGILSRLNPPATATALSPGTSLRHLPAFPLHAAPGALAPPIRYSLYLGLHSARPDHSNPATRALPRQLYQAFRLPLPLAATALAGQNIPQNPYTMLIGQREGDLLLALHRLQEVIPVFHAFSLPTVLRSVKSTFSEGLKNA